MEAFYVKGNKIEKEEFSVGRTKIRGKRLKGDMKKIS